MRVLAIVVVLVACGDDDSMPLCFTEDGRGVAAGAVDPDDPCRVCDARTARLRARWAPGCGEERTIEQAMSYFAIPELGPDADGDGVGDIALFGGLAPEGGTTCNCLEVRSVATGDLIARLVDQANVNRVQMRLGPDADGDGLADLLVGSSAALSDLGDPFDPYTAGENPDPGHVVLFSPVTGEVAHEWVGESDCRALGYWVDLGPDVDGDGLADPMISDPGCVEIEETPDGPVTRGSTDGHVTIYSGASDEIVVRWDAPPGRGGFGRQGRFIPDQTGDGIDEVVLYLNRTPEDPFDRLTIYDPTTGGVVQEWEWGPERPFALFWTRWFGHDLTGDGEIDAIATLRSEELVGDWHYPNGVLPSMSRPVGDVTVFADWDPRNSSRLQVVPDVDGDGADDVLFGDPDAGKLRLLNAWNEVIWSVDYVETPAFPQVSRGFDVDDDGLVDFATIDDDGFFVSVRIFLSRGLP